MSHRAHKRQQAHSCRTRPILLTTAGTDCSRCTNRAMPLLYLYGRPEITFLIVMQSGKMNFHTCFYYRYRCNPLFPPSPLPCTTNHSPTCYNSSHTTPLRHKTSGVSLTAKHLFHAFKSNPFVVSEPPPYSIYTFHGPSVRIKHMISDSSHGYHISESILPCCSRNYYCSAQL
jgi:hypothetical protein